MPIPRLRVIVGHHVQRELDLEGPVTIGRRPDNDVVLRDDAVSGHHGRVEPSGAGWRYIDLGSMNGSLVAAGPHLKPGESVDLDELTQILIGHTVLEYRPADEGPPSEFTPSSKTSAPSWEPARDADPATATARSLPGLVQPTPVGPQAGAPQPAATGTPPAVAPAQHVAPQHRQRAAPAGLGEGGLILTPAVKPPPELARKAEGPPDSDIVAAGQPAPATPLVRPGPQAPLRPARLLVVLGGGVEVHDLSAARAVLGRSAEADVQVPHPSVSDEHLELRHADGQWQVTDLGSTNGTRVGLAPLQGSRGVTDLSHVIVGAVDVLFLDHARPAQGDIDAARFVAWLRKRRQLNRRQASACLAAVAQEGARVEELLVRERLLAPGAITELRHNAARAFTEGPHPKVERPTRWPAWQWLLLVAVAAALVWGLLA